MVVHEWLWCRIIVIRRALAYKLWALWVPLQLRPLGKGPSHTPTLDLRPCLQRPVRCATVFRFRLRVHIHDGATLLIACKGREGSGCHAPPAMFRAPLLRIRTAAPCPAHRIFLTCKDALDAIIFSTDGAPHHELSTGTCGTAPTEQDYQMYWKNPDEDSF